MPAVMSGADVAQGGDDLAPVGDGVGRCPTVGGGW